jgi:hypothetical protein
MAMATIPSAMPIEPPQNQAHFWASRAASSMLRQ